MTCSCRQVIEELQACSCVAQHHHPSSSSSSSSHTRSSNMQGPFQSVDNVRDMVLGCLLNCFILGLLTSLYVAYINKRFLEPLVIRALLVAIAIIALTQTSLSASIALHVLRHLRQEHLDVRHFAGQAKALQALYGLSTILISSYFITRIYKATRSLATALLLSLLAAANFAVKLIIVLVAFRVGPSGSLTHQTAHQLLNLQWSQSIIEAILSSAITSILISLIICHRRSHGPAWHVPVLRSLLLETTWPVIPLVIAQCCDKVIREPYVATITFSNTLAVCLLCTLWARPTHVTSKPTHVRAASIATIEQAAALAQLVVDLDGRRLSATAAPFSVGGSIDVQAKSGPEAHIGAVAPPAHLAGHDVHGLSRHSPSCPSPRHHWRFSWPSPSAQSAHSDSDSLLQEPVESMQSAQELKNQHTQTYIEKAASQDYLPLLSSSRLREPAPVRLRSTSRGRSHQLERSFLRYSLSNQTKAQPSPQDDAISSLYLPSPAQNSQTSKAASLDDLAINFGRPSPSPPQEASVSAQTQGAANASTSAPSSGQRGEPSATSLAVSLGSWPFLSRTAAAAEAEALSLAARRILAPPSASLSAPQVSSQLASSSAQSAAFPSSNLANLSLGSLPPIRPSLIAFSTYSLSNRRLVNTAVEESASVSPLAPRPTPLAEPNVTFSTTIESLVSSLNQAMLERSATTLEKQDINSLFNFTLVSRRASA